MNDNSPVSIIGCGYIGKRLAIQLQGKDVAVHGFVSSETSLAECEALNVPCEIIDLDETLPVIDLTGRKVI